MADSGVSRRTLLRLMGLGLLRPHTALAESRGTYTVEDWNGHAIGAKGIPEGWREYETPFGHAKYDFTVVTDGARQALNLKSAGDHSTIAKQIHIDLVATPVLRWQWKVLRLPRGADLRNRATSDATGHLFVVWPRFPTLVRSRLIGYVWDPQLPAGSVVESRKTNTVTFIVVRSGDRELGRWLDEERDLVQDYRTLYGEPAPPPEAVALSIDTNDTRTAAEALFGRIAFGAH